MTKGEIAKGYFLAGMNCSTAVVLAFSEEIGLDKEVLKKMAIGFGGGLGRQRLTCGAVSGMCMVLSLLKSDGENKGEIYPLIQRACEEFKSQNGSIICGELLSGKVEVESSPIPEQRSNEYYKKRPCGELVQLAGDIAEKYIKE